MKLNAVFAVAVLSIVGILIVPLPPPILDVLLAINIFGSALVLVISLRVEEPLEFSAFAPALLLATLFRLSLDVSATRLILTQGHIVGGVGAIVPAFGAFVVGGNLVVGFIVFAILITIQFIVIASGAQRVAEVCARFTLDAMPGKQMAIDAEVHAGSLDAATARTRRARIGREADFYAAMDGAGKFIKGDAIAALVIVALNIIGGVIVGVAYRGMDPLDALQTFAILTIGNALVTTLPAFLISTAMGLMVTRVTGERALGADLVLQLVARPDTLRIAGGLMAVLAFVPALPAGVFGSLAVGAFLGAAASGRARTKRTTQDVAARDRARRDAIRRPESAFALVGVDTLSIEFGSELYALLAAPNVEALLDRIGDIRRALAAETGIVIPGVRLRDDGARDPRTYAIRVRDRIVGEGVVRLDALVAVAPPEVLAAIAGEPTNEPVYGIAAKWIAPTARAMCESAGALTFDAISIIGSHLSELVRRHAADIFGRQELQTLVEYLRQRVPSTMKDVGTEPLSIPTAHRAFGYLLRERAWPRDPVSVFEAMVDAAPSARSARDLAEAVRRTIVPEQLLRENVRLLQPVMIAPEFDSELTRMWSDSLGLAPDARTALHVRSAIEKYVANTAAAPHCIVASSALRAPLAEFFERVGPPVSVYAFSEVPPSVQIAPVAILGPATAP